MSEYWKWKKIRDRREAEQASPKPHPEAPKGPLYQVWGKIEDTGHEVVAVASAIQPNGPESSAKALHRAFPTQELAEAGLAKLLVELRDVILAEGGRVLDVETDGL